MRPTSRLACTGAEWIIDGDDPREDVRLGALDGERLADATRVALRGSGYGTEDEALEAGLRWRALLMRAFVDTGVAADFGDRSPAGLRLSSHARAAAATASGRQILEDIHGLIVFECEPPAVFVGAHAGGVVVSSSHDQLVSDMSQAVRAGGLRAGRQVTYDLFAASKGQESVDARFALLMIAVETMLHPAARTDAACRHVELLISSTKSSSLDSGEISSLVSSLGWLLEESISKTARTIAKKLGDRRYKEMTPAAFITECYDIRSQLLHGHDPLPTWEEISKWTGPLEQFVTDLLRFT